MRFPEDVVVPGDSLRSYERFPIGPSGRRGDTEPQGGTNNAEHICRGKLGRRAQ